MSSLHWASYAEKIRSRQSSNHPSFSTDWKDSQNELFSQDKNLTTEATMSAPTQPPFIKTIHHDIYEAIDPRTTMAGKARGKTILITGAGRGIGRSISIAFAQAGADRLILVELTTPELNDVADEIQRAFRNTKVLSFPVDITKESEVATIFESIKGRVDVLINNAGYLERNVNLGDSDTHEWWYTWEVNVKGTYLLTNHFLKKYSGLGTIINTSSFGSIITTVGFSAYQPTKTAINRITDFLQKEYPKARVFAYHPGGVQTKLTQNISECIRKLLIDSPDIAGGYCLWLTTEAADFLRGRYSDCTWDIHELMKSAKLILEKDLLKEQVKMF